MRGCVGTMESIPPSYASSFLDTLLATLRQLDRLQTDPSASKDDVIGSVRTHLSVLLRKSLSTPMNTSFCVLQPVSETDG